MLIQCVQSLARRCTQAIREGPLFNVLHFAAPAAFLPKNLINFLPAFCTLLLPNQLPSSRTHTQNNNVIVVVSFKIEQLANYYKVK